MSNTAKPWTKVFRGVFWAAVLVVVIYLIARNVGIVGNVAVVLLGFGAVVLVHEFGHFIVAKLSGIKVEAFSIFMPPTLVGLRRTSSGLRLRFLPSLTSDKGDAPAEETEHTEYRVGTIPFGGYVKLLGQEDTGPVKQVDDPRSFAHKPVGVRIAVISAGVTFNVISAALIFMVVFLVGIKLIPPVVGGVVPGSSAAQAGIEPGDVFVEIAGTRKDLDFSNIMIASALSDANEVVPATVRRADGSLKDVTLVAAASPSSSFREFGVLQPLSLTVAAIDAPEILRERTGLLPKDRIVAVNGQDVEHHWEFTGIVEQTLTPSVKITAERPTDGGTTLVSTELPVYWTAARGAEVASEQDLNHVYSMVPRLRVAAVDDLGRAAAQAGDGDSEPRLRADDIILAAGDLEYPTYKEVREVTVLYEDKPLPLKVLRTDANGVEQTLTVTVRPKRAASGDRVVIGFLPALDAGHAVVARTIATEGGPPALDIPRGARIIRVNDRPVASFYDLIAEVRRWGTQEVTLQYELDGRVEGGVTLQLAQATQPIRVEATSGEMVPFRSLERLYCADGPLNAIAMGYRRTVMFIAQTYVTLKQLISGLVSPKELMGPVGIISFSYRIVAEQPLVNYAYFLGLISATIAVVNFLPVPPFDGGLVLLMLIEKVRGAALSERAQGIVAYAGWALVLMLLMYVTFNDIVRTFFS